MARITYVPEVQCPLGRSNGFFDKAYINFQGNIAPVCIGPKNPAIRNNQFPIEIFHVAFARSFLPTG
jgi:hypothetical protein